MKRFTTLAVFLTLLTGTAVLGYGITNASARLTTHEEVAGLTTGSAATGRSQARTPAQQVAARPAPLKLRPELVPGAAILQPGDSGDRVRDLEARLKQIGWFGGLVDADYDGTTAAAVRGFQGKRRIAVTGKVDRRTRDRLNAMTRTPTREELHNIAPRSTSHTNAPLDRRCTTGRALCIDKSSRTLRWVVDGKVLKTVDVRFGSTVNNTPTREGSFRVGWKSPNHVSKLFDSPMPFAMFFSGGQAVHYSSDFAARGYNGASHGCVNVRDYEGIKWLYSQVAVGDTVIVYWS